MRPLSHFNKHYGRIQTLLTQEIILSKTLLGKNHLNTTPIRFYNQINGRALIGQWAVSYCAGKPMEKSRVFWIII